MKIFDYYYLVMLRYNDCIHGKEKLSYYVPGYVGFTLTINIFSFALLINPSLIGNNYFWITIGIISALTIIVIDVIYNKKHRARIREQHKNESRASRQRGIFIVALYEILSIAFLVWIVSTSV